VTEKKKLFLKPATPYNILEVIGENLAPPALVESMPSAPSVHTNCSPVEAQMSPQAPGQMLLIQNLFLQKYPPSKDKV